MYQFDKKETGLNIYRLVEGKKMTNAQFADIMNVSEVTVYKWFTGKSTPSYDHFIQMRYLFDVELDRLFVTKKTGTEGR